MRELPTPIKTIRLKCMGKRPDEETIKEFLEHRS